MGCPFYNDFFKPLKVSDKFESIININLSGIYPHIHHHRRYESTEEDAPIQKVRLTRLVYY